MPVPWKQLAPFTDGGQPIDKARPVLPDDELVRASTSAATAASVAWAMGRRVPGVPTRPGFKPPSLKADSVAGASAATAPAHGRESRWSSAGGSGAGPVVGEPVEQLVQATEAAAEALLASWKSVSSPGDVAKHFKDGYSAAMARDMSHVTTLDFMLGNWDRGDHAHNWCIHSGRDGLRCVCCLRMQRRCVHDSPALSSAQAHTVPGL